MGTVTTTTVIEDDKEVGAKVYHGIPGSNVVARDGTVSSFDAKGKLEVTSLLLQKELDKVANKPGTGIFTDDRSGAVPAPNADQPVEDIKQKAAATVAALNAAQAAGKPQ